MGDTVRGILQARILEWVAAFQPTRLLCPWDFPGKDTGVGCHFLLQGIFPTQGSNLGILHLRQILLGIESSHWGLRTSLQHQPKVCLCSVEALRKSLSSLMERTEAGGEITGMAAWLLVRWGDSLMGNGDAVNLCAFPGQTEP